MVKWIVKLDDFGFSPRVDILMVLVKHLVKDENQRPVQVQDFAEGKNIGKNRITRLLNRYPILSIKSASRIDIARRPAYACNPRIINDHFTSSAKSYAAADSLRKPLTNVMRRALLWGWHREHVLLLAGVKKTHV